LSARTGRLFAGSGSRGSAFRLNQLVSQRIKTEWRSAEFLRDRNTGCRITVPGVAITDVINLSRCLKTAGRRPGIVFVKKAGFNAALAVSKKGKINLPVLSRGGTNVNAKVVGRPFFQGFRIENDLDLWIVASGVVENHVGHDVTHHPVSLYVLAR
jgi:hypothetical protein